MEQELRIKIPGTKLKIHGFLRGKKSAPLVVFVHGLTGNMNEHLFFNGARWFEKKGFATFRFNLYDWEKGTRKIEDCTIQTHADDLDVVLAAMRRRGFKRIHVVGHSYGGATIVASQSHGVLRATLWDPTALPTFKKYDTRPSAEKNMYRLPGGYTTLIGKAMYDENETLNSPAKLNVFVVPSKVICAEKCELLPIWKKAFRSYGWKQHILDCVKGATHCFDEDGKAEELYKKTLAWMTKQNNR